MVAPRVRRTHSCRAYQGREGRVFTEMVEGLKYRARMSVVLTWAGTLSRVFLSSDETMRCGMRVDYFGRGARWGGSHLPGA